ncbi:rod shape-determining protein MreC [Photobacterium angustum]|uniref:Cell shape-determining protein MreC n=2 Tax=Photobacterium angustum TaxID=661 RepID=Q1ZNR7_PHOAS|nr:rod shape-determining protein MreC [Photobacterium angustum]KJF81138.1 rod shape-determining protein MreC [Photobacterium damselae subsp. damselae]EAS63662.1 putative rod shape-determining protein MreC [Vibrio angustum S14] [Photobacterium angustum S14]KJG29552.1 rod shape-determining protein MreC [Photobacterium angustum]KJG39286.1 rod shape-determining protein MreC [Photobacterium angustum]KJG44650.1 rod shape-determining protein MreC [Photobacterium angustum]
MKPIFGRGPSLQLRLFLAILLSASLMLADSRLDAFANVRYFLNSAIAPLQYAANLPRELLDGLNGQMSSHQQLLVENKALKRDLLVMKSNVLLLDQLQQENQRLRNLLGSPFVRGERKMIAEVMAVDSDPYSHQVMIDKGRVDGVYEGQPVINDKGIVGQISYVGAHNSRVLLLIDPTNAIPVQVVRNDIRVIATGTGKSNEIQLEHVPSSTDIRVGDLLVSSGLGGRYPEGYPVARVTEFSFDNKRPFAQIIAKPTVQFDRLRYLLLVWPTDRMKAAETSATKSIAPSSAVSTISPAVAVPANGVKPTAPVENKKPNNEVNNAN